MSSAHRRAAAPTGDGHTPTLTQDEGLTLSPATKKAVFAGVAGTVIEWYDFALYGVAAGLVLGPLFFEPLGSTGARLASLATFAVGFGVRPIGGLLFANLGDRIGRKPVLILTLLLMGAATTAIGLLPSFGTVGIVAPILLVILRMLQGAGAGAELAGAITLVSEYASPRRRGLVNGMVNGIGGGGGTMLATLAFLLVGTLPDASFSSWGWRIPFLFSAVLFALALFIRHSLEETPEYQKAVQKNTEQRVESAPVLRVIAHYPLQTIGGYLMWNGHNCIFYLTTTFALSYLVGERVGMDRPIALLLVTIASILHIITAPQWGRLGDRIGFHRAEGLVLAIGVLSIYPYFLLLSTGAVLPVLVAMILGYAVVAGGSNGNSGAFSAHLFPTKYRYSGIAVIKELSAATIGGTTPLIATWLIERQDGGFVFVSLFAGGMALFGIVGIILTRYNREGRHGEGSGEHA